MKKIMLLLAALQTFPLLGVLSPDVAAQLGVNPNATNYEILGIKNGASATEQKKAYHKLSRQWHTDRNPDGAEVMKAINNANENLNNGITNQPDPAYGAYTRPTNNTYRTNAAPNFGGAGTQNYNDFWEDFLRDLREQREAAEQAANKRRAAGATARHEQRLKEEKMFNRYAILTTAILIGWPFAAVGIREFFYFIKKKVQKKSKLASKKA